MAIVPAALLALLGGLLTVVYSVTPIRILGGFFVFLGIALAVGLLLQFRRPRIGYADGQVLFFLKSGGPIAVPLNSVEAFFLGQGPLHLPVQTGNAETVNLVARFSRRSSDWMERDVKSALGKWTDGYATIRGTWCEPLNGEVIRRLNRRLREATEEFKASDAGNNG